MVGYEEESNFYSEAGGRSWHYVLVRSLRTGKLIRRVASGPAHEHGGVGGRVVAMVVKDDGAVAWIAEDVEHDIREYSERKLYNPGYRDVYAADRLGTRLLAQGFDVPQASLKLRGTTIHWTQGGKAMSAALD